MRPVAEAHPVKVLHAVPCHAMQVMLCHVGLLHSMQQVGQAWSSDHISHMLA